MEPFPKPEMLDPDRLILGAGDDMNVADHRDQAEILKRALTLSCEYAEQLWLDVARARTYLLESLPPDPYSSEASRRWTSPGGKDDHEGWQRWIDAYTELTSVLAGPHGDSGMGRSEALRAAALRRRDAPGDESADNDPPGPHSAGARSQPDAIAPGAVGPRFEESNAQDVPAEPDTTSDPGGEEPTAKPVNRVAAALSALRGPRRRKGTP